MEIMKQYFSFRMATECNIPRFIIQGTEQDWLQVFILNPTLVTAR